MAGRKPIPIAVYENKHKHSKADIAARIEGEPKGCSDKLLPPKELKGEALKEWKRVVALYRELDAAILNDLDISLLSAYCESVAIYRKAQVEYKKQPLIIVDGNSVRENPLLRVMRMEGANIAKYSEQLCLSPVGRARMGVIAAKREVSKDPMTAFFEKHGND